jgi:eukaryotic-like serine/threonine-protein kinase
MRPLPTLPSIRYSAESMARAAVAPERAPHYDVLGELATGGMATVYVGLQRRQGANRSRLVAIKSMRQELAEDDAFHAMFLDEATLTARINHPNVVRTLDVVSSDGRLLIVMEYVEGVSLARLLDAAYRRRVPLRPPVAIAILGDVLRGLHAAHELVDEHGRPLSVVHRDVSPQNILVGVDGVARIIDFGIAKAASQRHVTALGEIKGKLAYMPPEQQLAETVDRRSDVYAAGVVLWEMISGRRLFAADNEDDLVRQVFEGRIDPPSHFADEPIPLEVDRTVLRALSRSREDRWWSAEEMARALSSALAPAPRREIVAIVRDLGKDELAERERHIYELQEHHAANTSVLGREAQIVLDVLSTGRRRLAAETSIPPPMHSPSSIPPPPSYPRPPTPKSFPPPPTPAAFAPAGPPVAYAPGSPPLAFVPPGSLPAPPPPHESLRHSDPPPDRASRRASRRSRRRRRSLVVFLTLGLGIAFLMLVALLVGLQSRHDEPVPIPTSPPPSLTVPAIQPTDGSAIVQPLPAVSASATKHGSKRR